jgi:hypothetical protein
MKSLGWLFIATVVPLMTQCAKPPAPRPEWAFNVSIKMTPDALANLKGDKSVLLDVLYYGTPAPGSKQEPDAVGRLPLGDDQFSTNYDNPHIHITGDGIDQNLLGDVVNREIYIQVTVNSRKARTPDDPPFVECISYHGTIKMAHTTTPVVTCDKYRP